MKYVAVTEAFVRAAREHASEHQGGMLAVPGLTLDGKVGTLGILGISVPSNREDAMRMGDETGPFFNHWQSRGREVFLYARTRENPDRYHYCDLIDLYNTSGGAISVEVVIGPHDVLYRQVVKNGQALAIGTNPAKVIAPETLQPLDQRRLDKIVEELSAPSAFPPSIEGQVFPKVPILGR